MLTHMFSVIPQLCLFDFMSTWKVETINLEGGCLRAIIHILTSDHEKNDT